MTNNDCLTETINSYVLARACFDRWSEQKTVQKMNGLCRAVIVLDTSVCSPVTDVAPILCMQCS